MYPIIIEFDYQDPERVLLSLALEPGLCFLDSSKQDKQLGRFSYIAIDPVELINSDLLAGNPFDYLNTRLSLYRAETIQDLPPFQGGALGYFGYDLLHHLENIPKPAQDIINIPDMMIGLYDLLIAFDHEQRKAWIISQGFPEIEIKARQERAKMRAQWVFEKLQSPPAEPQPWKPLQQGFIQSNFSQEGYCQAVQKIIDYIYAGDVFQANISQCFSSMLPENFNAMALYLELRKKNPAPFSAFLKFDDLCIASASPERFIRLENNKIQTRPIKGTRPRSKNLQEDKKFADELLASEKDRAENIMIVDLMRNDLGDSALRARVL
jgi:para-aminobenzoate synthetase component I